MAILETVVRRRRPKPAFLPLLPWGYLQYRLCGRYRTARGGGGPGLSNPPVRIVSTGPYAFSRNPMYLGHLTFTAGLVLSTRSRLAAAALVALVPWFDRHAEGDERHLLAIFGNDYQAYCDAVPRWLGHRSVCVGSPSSAKPLKPGTATAPEDQPYDGQDDNEE